MKYRLPARLMGPLLLMVVVAATPAAPPEAVSTDPIVEAAMRGDAETLRALLAEGWDVNAREGDGTTALHWAALNGDVESVALLLASGADLEAVTRNGDYTALHMASMEGHAEVVEMLLAAGSRVEARTSSGGVTALHLAARAGQAGAVAALVAHGAEVDSREEARNQTPLMFAAAWNRLDAMDALLEAGASTSARSRVVDLPTRQEIDRMAQQRRREVLDEFRQAAGAPTNWRPSASEVQAAVEAAQEVQREALRTLQDVEEMEHEVDMATGEISGFSGLVGRQGGLTPLLHAAREGHVEAALKLVEAGADIDGVSGGDNTSPMLIATINGHFDLALALLERGADPNIASHAGATPLYTAINTHWAPRSRYPQQFAYMSQEATYLDVMKALLEAGADPDVRLNRHLWYKSYTFDLLRIDSQGATPFWRAAYATDVEAMKLLVEHGADPSLPTIKPVERRRGYGGGPQEDPSGLPPIPDGGPGVFPIHAAAGVGYGEGFAGNAHRHVPGGWLPAVRYLVEELGADVNARDHNGFSPLHHAAARGDNELIEYLISKGADVTVVSRRGQTTVDMANGPVERISPFPRTIALLEGLGAKNNNNCLSC
jgi:uncharacterized protein